MVGSECPNGVHIRAEGLTKAVRGGLSILNDVSFSVRPGELVGVVGGSGAGKTTLLEAVAGVGPADSGRVLFDGVDASRNRDAFRSVLGYVPQDDIIHAELPLARTLRYAAELRLPPTATPAQVDAAVAGAMRSLDLSARAGVHVSALSGGQRKRASIAVELLTKPRVFFLDEPTSGLDPATDAELLRVLRGLADTGTTVMFTTHAVQDLAACDRILFLTRGGRLAFDGSLEQALAYFDALTAEEVYERLARDASPEEWARRFAERSSTDRARETEVPTTSAGGGATVHGAPSGSGRSSPGGPSRRSRGTGSRSASCWVPPP
jgi:ABC-type multidrug transport system ATPase subunit